MPNTKFISQIPLYDRIKALLDVHGVRKTEPCSRLASFGRYMDDLLFGDSQIIHSVLSTIQDQTLPCDSHMDENESCLMTAWRHPEQRVLALIETEGLNPNPRVDDFYTPVPMPSQTIRVIDLDQERIMTIFMQTPFSHMILEPDEALTPGDRLAYETLYKTGKLEEAAIQPATPAYRLYVS